MIAATPEELALDLSRASLAAQEQSENQLREKATAVLGHNQGILEDAAGRVGRAVLLLTSEILLLVVALIITLLR